MKLAQKTSPIFFRDLVPWMLVLVYAICLYFLAYHVPRQNFGTLLSLFSACLALSLVLYFKFVELGFSFHSTLFAALFLRLVCLFAIPQLSDDYFRYFFDGHLIGNGINPYFYLPELSKEMLLIGQQDMWEELYAGMNSRSYFTIYPPLHQGIFYLTTVWADSVFESIVLLRVIIMLFDLFNIFLLKKLLLRLGSAVKGVSLYAFSPLVILELTGNLHFEGIVLALLLSTLLLIQKMKIGGAASTWALAIGLKLVPLILAPLWLARFEKRAILKFALVSGFMLLVLFCPFLNGEVLGNFLESFQLFQRKFEFNASIYFVVREVYMGIVGYNPIKYIVPVLNLIALTCIFMIAFRTKSNKLSDLLASMVWIYMAYLLLQPVVHPWYIIPVFGLGILAREWTPIIWSGLIILSYSAYQSLPVVEEPAFLWLQYSPLYLYMAYRFLYQVRLFKSGI